MGRDGVYRVVDKGPLAPAVVASAAIPILFANVDIDGVGADDDDALMMMTR